MREDFMRHGLIALGILALASLGALQPGFAQNGQRAFGDDDLPNGAPVQEAAARPKAVCYTGPLNPTPNCIFDSIAECRAACRTKRLHGGYRRSRVQCMLNPALRQPAPRS
jgi:hypothetical protein